MKNCLILASLLVASLLARLILASLILASLLALDSVEQKEREKSEELTNHFISQ
jgi:hypothetical protein